MLRSFATSAVLVLLFGTAGWAQTPSALSASDGSKSVTKKPTRRNDTPAAESGPCHIGVIPIAGNLFLVQRFGVDRVAAEGWGLDELVFSRVRAAAPGRSVRRVPFTAAELIRGAQRPTSLFGDSLKEFRHISGNFGTITCLTFSPDGQYLATGGSDAVVYIWPVKDFFKRPDFAVESDADTLPLCVGIDQR